MKLPGINIQWPWSELLIDGKKRVETRSYPIPVKYLNTNLAVIETPGSRGFKEAGIAKARIIGLIKFSECYCYKSKQHWKSEEGLHLVSLDDPNFSFDSDKPKWAWTVSEVRRFQKPIPAPFRRGIRFTQACQIPIKY
jgi:hypothetical protein